MFSEVAAASPDVGSLSRRPLHKSLQCTKGKLPPPDSGSLKQAALLGLEVVAASPKVGVFKQAVLSWVFHGVSSPLRGFLLSRKLLNTNRW